MAVSSVSKTSFLSRTGTDAPSLPSDFQFPFEEGSAIIRLEDKVIPSLRAMDEEDVGDSEDKEPGVYPGWIEQRDKVDPGWVERHEEYDRMILAAIAS